MALKYVLVTMVTANYELLPNREISGRDPIEYTGSIMKL